MPTALLTGYHGFLGKHLTTKLEQLGFRVFGLERNWRSAEEWGFLDVDYIFNLASFGNHSTQLDDQEIFETNVMSLWDLLGGSRYISYKGFINFSTSGHILECNSFYGATKMSGEYLARAFAKQYNKPIVNIRPFSAYGPGEASHRFIPTIISKGLKGQVLELTEGVHDWIYISDMIDGVIKVMENVDKLKGQSIDIGTGEQHTNTEVVNILKEWLPDLKVSDSRGLKRSYDTTDKWVADTQKLANLGVFKTHSLKEGLRKTYDYHKSKS